MREGITRRRAIAALSGIVVVGFDPDSGAWVTSASAAPRAHHLPELDGTLSLDPVHREAAADDFGHLVHRLPAAVLLPGSVDDVVAMVRYARRHRVPVAMRGQGHAQFGQCQTAGLVIDSSSLSTIHSVSAEGARVDAGVRWSELVLAAAEQGLTPPVLTDYLELAVGGTLSVGGIGGGIGHFGSQADNVLELEVVTGDGELVTCSRRSHPQLFDAVAAGLGQCALILRATVRLVPAHQQALVFHLFYDDIEVFVRDQLELVRDGRFDYLEGQVVSAADGAGWRFMIEAARFHTPPRPPDELALLRGLSDDASTRERIDQPHLDFAFRLVQTVEFLKSIGAWNLPHPWLSLFLPARGTARYVSDVLATLTTADTGQGPILLYPLLRKRVHRPFFRLPHDDVSFAFNILRTAPTDRAVQRAMLKSNRTLYEQAVRIGGTRYASGAIPMAPADWRAHFGDAWEDLIRAKRRFDPRRILTPGVGLFRSPS